MSISNEEKAGVLIEALPYIQKYTGKTIVVKYGGNAMLSDELRNAVISDLVLLSLTGINVVLVHGGGPDINDMLRKIGKKSQFINGLRYTDAETADVALMVLAGKTNKQLVDLIGRTGGRAIGLCGLDGGLIKATKYTDEHGTDYGFVGDIHSVNTEVITDVINRGYIPVISTVAHAVDGDGELLHFLAALCNRKRFHAVIAKLFIDFVREHENLRFFANLGNFAHFFFAIHRTRGVGRRIENEHFRFRRNRRF